MRSVQEYRQNAADCRALAKNMQRPEDRARLIEMPNTWDRLASSREGKLLVGLKPEDV